MSHASRPIVLTAMLALAGCAGEPDVPAPAVPPAKEPSVAAPAAERAYPARASARHLPNAVWLHEKVLSGGQPEGAAGFQELQVLGVRTVISVDGARPDVTRAKEYGLRYVHLPHGYDGIPEDRVRELAKAVRDLPGPVYIHCHHGKHRSPAAAAVACVSTGLLAAERAIDVLRLAGTSENYRGLYQSAGAAQRLDDELLDRLQAEFPETARLPPLADAMVAIEHTHDALKDMQAAGWKPLAQHPDLEPAHEALLLREHFTELLRSDETQARPAPFRELLRQSEAAAAKLEESLRQPATRDEPPTAAAALQQIAKACTACHREFRDVPLQEKAQAR